MLVKNVLLIKKKKIGSPENTNYFKKKKVKNTKGKKSSQKTLLSAVLLTCNLAY